MSLDQIGHAALSSRATLQSSYDIARLAIQNCVPGDFVECGVFGGAQCAAMAQAIAEHEQREHLWRGPFGQDINWGLARHVHLFDSFEGIPAAGEHDTNWTHPPGQSACSIEAVKSMMKQWGIPEELLVYHPGWFRESLYGSALLGLERIAVLRLDCDLYESTKLCLEVLYPLVSPGGWIIVDDFALPGCRKAVDEFLQREFPPIYFQKV
jgi:O-methyltransferase